MVKTFLLVFGFALIVTAFAEPASAGWPGDRMPKCPPDSVKVGATCVDKYEASLWQLPISELNFLPGKRLIKKIQKGLVTLADLNAIGATQLAVAGSCAPAIPPSFPNNGNWTPVAYTDPPTPGIYAVSIPGVLPSACLTWFQAEEACALSNKRLIRNQDWQRAAAGTQDPDSNDGLANTKCNTSSAGPRSTGLAGSLRGDATSCVSNWGAQDMIGNVWEWVGDWGDVTTDCTLWDASHGGDQSCIGGDGSSNLPGAWVRGGSWFYGSSAGVFAISALNVPSFTADYVGFRCAR